ncbi:MAG: response regulator [Candidatus Omnitrophica bacterium]|nr:response regulator [Candidatus Omnitrophota bacterium]
MPKKILIIDDEELIIKSLAKLLDKNGFEVFLAKKGDDALVIFEEESFDLIISDIKMPGIDGIKTVQSIYNSLEEQGKIKIPVIFITGYADQNNQTKAESLNPVAFLCKPFDIAELLEIIRGIFK